jgi:hypothetical protein
MNRVEYNGWTNYETWLVKLWLDNEPSTYELQRELTNAHRQPSKIADALKDYIEENSPVSEAGLYTDLLNSALSEVDWYSIAEHCVADFLEPDETEEE